MMTDFTWFCWECMRGECEHHRSDWSTDDGHAVPATTAWEGTPLCTLCAVRRVTRD